MIPVLAPVIPLLLGVNGNRLLLSTGHGFYHRNTGGRLNNWFSFRPYIFRNAGEDVNDAYMGAFVDSILVKNGMQVDNMREVRNFTLPGVRYERNAQNPQVTFPLGTIRGFPRLWMQNPVYYLGQLNRSLNPPESFISQVPNNFNAAGTNVRSEEARRWAIANPPIDIYLALHTNASDAHDKRGSVALYLDVWQSTINTAESNLKGRNFALHLVNRVRAFCQTSINNGGARSLRANNHGRIAELVKTYDYFTRNTGGTEDQWQRASVNTPGWIHRTFPRDIPVAIAEVAFHDNLGDAKLLGQDWFRRRAAEAMATAVEDQLLEDPSFITRPQMIALLEATFGPTSRTIELRNNNNDLISDFVTLATGYNDSLPLANLTLLEAVTKIKNARRAYLLRTFIDELTNALLESAGYPVEDKWRQKVSNQILYGRSLRGGGNSPVTRGEAGRLVAAGLGLTPICLNSVMQIEFRDVNYSQPPILLFDLLQGHVEEDKILSRIDAENLMDKIRNIHPIEIYRISDLFLTNNNRESLKLIEDGIATYRLSMGTPLCIVAITRGVPWYTKPEDIKFSIRNNSGFQITFPGSVQESDKVVSVPLEKNNLPVSAGEMGTFTLSISARHVSKPNEEYLLYQTEIRVYMV